LKTAPFNTWLHYLRDLLTTSIIGVLGAFLAWYIYLPAPYIIGPAIFCTIAALWGLNVRIPNLLRNICFATIGIALGSNITPNSMIRILEWPTSLLFMCFSILLITVIGTFILKSWFKIDKVSSILASSPGLLSYVLNLSVDTKSNTPVISIIQSIRILIITITIPFTIMLTTELNTEVIDFKINILSLKNIILLYVFSLIAGMVLTWINIPAAFLVGGTIFSLIGHLTGFTPGDLPDSLSVIAFIVLGSLIGSRFTGVKMQILASCFFSGLFLTIISLIISLSIAFLVKLITNIDYVDLIIAFAPGGLETMLAMGSIVNADPTFLATHHIFRLIILGVIIPSMIFGIRKL